MAFVTRMFCGASLSVLVALPSVSIAAPICADAGPTSLPPGIVSISAGPTTDAVLRTRISAFVRPPGEIIEVSGSTIRVTLTIGMHGFTATPRLHCTVRLPILAPGSYILEYYLMPQASDPPMFIEARTFSVADNVTAIPVLGWPAILALCILIMRAGRQVLSIQRP